MTSVDTQSRQPSSWANNESLKSQGTTAIKQSLSPSLASFVTLDGEPVVIHSFQCVAPSLQCAPTASSQGYGSHSAWQQFPLLDGLLHQQRIKSHGKLQKMPRLLG